MILDHNERLIYELRENGETYKSLADKFNLTPAGVRDKYNKVSIFIKKEQEDVIARLDISPTSYRVIAHALNGITESHERINTLLELVADKFETYNKSRCLKKVSAKVYTEVSNALMKANYIELNDPIDIGLRITNMFSNESGYNYVEFSIKDATGIYRYSNDIEDGTIFLNRYSKYHNIVIIPQIIELLK